MANGQYVELHSAATGYFTPTGAKTSALVGALATTATQLNPNPNPGPDDPATVSYPLPGDTFVVIDDDASDDAKAQVRLTLFRCDNGLTLAAQPIIYRVGDVAGFDTNARTQFWLLGDVDGDGIQEVIRCWITPSPTTPGLDLVLSVYQWSPTGGTGLQKDGNGDPTGPGPGAFVQLGSDQQVGQGSPAFTFLTGGFIGKPKNGKKDPQVQLLQAYKNTQAPYEGFVSFVVYVWSDGAFTAQDAMANPTTNTVAHDTNATWLAYNIVETDLSDQFIQVYVDDAGQVGVDVFQWDRDSGAWNVSSTTSLGPCDGTNVQFTRPGRFFGEKSSSQLCIPLLAPNYGKGWYWPIPFSYDTATRKMSATSKDTPAMAVVGSLSYAVVGAFDEAIATDDLFYVDSTTMYVLTDWGLFDKVLLWSIWQDASAAPSGTQYLVGNLMNDARREILRVGPGTSPPTTWVATIYRFSAYVDGSLARYRPGSLDDLSGKGHPLSGTVTPVAGRFGAWQTSLAGSFTAGGTNTLTASIPDLPSGNNAVTVSLWFNTSYDYKTNNKAGSMVNWGSSASCRRFGVVVSQSSALCFTNQSDDLHGTTLVNDGKWHHCVVTQESGRVHIYLDGKLETSGFLYAINVDASQPLYLGQAMPSHDTPEYFEGDLDDVRIFAEKLTADQVLELYEEYGWPTVPPSPPPGERALPLRRRRPRKA